jgi:hypothetical protein
LPFSSADKSAIKSTGLRQITQGISGKGQLFKSASFKVNTSVDRSGKRSLSNTDHFESLLFQPHSSPWQTQSTPRMADAHVQFRIVSVLASKANRNTRRRFHDVRTALAHNRRRAAQIVNLPGAF